MALFFGHGFLLSVDALILARVCKRLSKVGLVFRKGFVIDFFDLPSRCLLCTYRGCIAFVHELLRKESSRKLGEYPKPDDPGHVTIYR